MAARSITDTPHARFAVKGSDHPCALRMPVQGEWVCSRCRADRHPTLVLRERCLYVGQASEIHPEFREQAARLVIETGWPTAHVAVEIRVSEQVLVGGCPSHVKRDAGRRGDQAMSNADCVPPGFQGRTSSRISELDAHRMLFSPDRGVLLRRDECWRSVYSGLSGPKVGVAREPGALVGPNGHLAAGLDPESDPLGR